MKKIIYVAVFVVVVLLVFAVIRNGSHSELTTDVVVDETTGYQDEVLVFQSDNVQFTVQYDEANEYARLSFNGVQYELQREVDASGARYVSEEGNVEFREQGGEAVVLIDGEIVIEEAQLIQNEDVVDTGSLIGTKWQWQETEYGDSENIIPNSPESFVIEFATESRFSATTDCNNISGALSYTKEGEMEFRQMISTKMACIETQETEFTASLSEVSEYHILHGGSMLELTFESGSMRFIRVD